MAVLTAKPDGLLKPMEPRPEDEFARILAEEVSYSYQPVVERATSSVTYVEALVRWQHPSLGLLSPASLLDLVKTDKQAELFTATGLDCVLRDLPLVKKTYGPSAGVGLNLSAMQLRNPKQSVALIETALALHSADPRDLRIEVVEDLTSSDLPSVKEPLQHLRALGVQIILDDFGTGASSLTALTDLAYDGIKIDQQFVAGVVSHSAARSVTEAIITFGRSLGITIVAEGVEDEVTLNALARLGCEGVQGYLFGRPAPIHELTMWKPIQPVAPARRSTPRTASTETLIETLNLRIAAMDPRSSDRDFAELSRQAASIEAEISTLPEADGDQLRCALGRTVTIAAMYGGEEQAALDWAIRTSNLAEDLGEPGLSAYMLALISTLPSTTDSGRFVRVEALARALQLRASTTLPNEEACTLDNTIGVALAHLGMIDRSTTWFNNAMTDHFDDDFGGAAFACLNLIEAELDRIDRDGGYRNADPESVLRIERALSKLRQSTFAPAGILEALEARYACIRGDADEAISNLGVWAEKPPEGVVATNVILRARAAIARQLGDAETFLALTEQMTAQVAGLPTLRHHYARSSRLHVEALQAVGRQGEAIQRQSDLFATERAHNERLVGSLFDWMQKRVDLDSQVGDLRETH